MSNQNYDYKGQNLRDQSFVGQDLMGAESLLFLIPAIVSAIVTFYLGKWLIESIQSRTGTSFKKANLTNANFSHALIEHTDFSFALLTGICIDGWMLDSHTLFAKSQCDYLYWNPERERFPHDRNFQADELKKFLSKFIKIKIKKKCIR